MANTLKFGNGEWYGKEGTILAYNDENRNYKPLPFNFERSSSATTINKQGLIETVGAKEPRIDYKDNTKGALLLEPTRSNLAIQSSIENMGGSGSNTGVVEFGNLNNGLESAEITVNGQRQWYFSTANIVAGTEYTVSFYVDSFDLSSSVRPIFYIPTEGTNGVSAIYGSQIVLGRNEKTFTATANGSQFRIGLGTSSNDVGSIKIGAVQIESGSYATSYIPTSGSAVTRVGDSSSQTAPDGVIGQTEGTILFDYTPYDVSSSISEDTIPLAISNNGSISDSIYLNDYNGDLDLFIRVGGIVQAKIQFSSLADNQRFKLGIGYAFNDLVFYVNGVQIGIDTSLSLPNCNQIKLNGFTSNVHINKINVNDFKLYNTRLSNSELQALTRV